MLEPLNVNGEPPALVGLTCDELLVSEYWYGGVLVEPANVVYLRFGGRWHRLYFDCGIVFWRPHDAAPEPEPEPIPPTVEGFAYPLADLGRLLGVRGAVLDHLVAAPIEGGSEIRLVFRNGAVLAFSNIADTTTFRAEPNAAPGPAGTTASRDRSSDRLPGR